MLIQVAESDSYDIIIILLLSDESQREAQPHTLCVLLLIHIANTVPHTLLCALYSLLILCHSLLSMLENE